MDFLKLFHTQIGPTSQAEPQPEVAKLIRQFMPKDSISSHIPLGLFSPFSRKEKPDLEYLHRIPLAERMKRFVDTGLYQKACQEMINKEIQEIKQEKVEKLKKEHPEFANAIGPKNVRFDAGALELIRDNFADMLLEAIFKKEEIDQAKRHLLDPNVSLTKIDIAVLKVCVYVWKHNLKYMAEHFGVKNGAFQSMIAKNAMELADMVGTSLKHDPRAVVSYGLECCRGIKGFDLGETALAGDQWIARWLDPKMLQALIQAQQLMPKEGSKTKVPTQGDILWTHRYQASFKTSLLYYFFRSPVQAQNVIRMVMPHLSKMDQGMQAQIWGILFQRYRVDSGIRGDVIQYMSSFLEQGANPKSQQIMYSLFIKSLSPDMRGDILGHMPFRTLKKYWATFGKKYPAIPYVSLQTDTGKTHMAWYLFYERELDDTHMRTLLEKANPKTQRDFLFAPKKWMDKDLFIHMCGIFSKSPFYFWQWVRSFRSAHDFPGSLANIYLRLPVSVKEYKPYVSAMDHHFSLVRECAIAGDTASLSALKKVLGSDLFWKSLTQETDKEISGVRSLCRQGKRGLLKLMADWPISKQQNLFMTTNSNGQTLLDECSGSLGRLVAQDIFKQPYQKVSEPSEPTPPKSVVLNEVPQPKPEKQTIPRQIIRIPAFEGHMAKIANNTKLVQEVEDTILALSRMGKAEISAELRSGWKHLGHLVKAPCAVKDIRGNNYRLGYLLRGDTDQGTGQIAILFFLTHAQYNIFLNKQADQAVKVATSMMTSARLAPSGPAGGNERQ